jgi:2-alkyl-3-oxoalkanoate reductase
VKQRVLVIGASGFIGERIIAALTSCEWAQPVAASRHIDRCQFVPNVERLALDATDASAVSNAIQDTPYVVNCVAGTASTIVASGKALFEAARQCTLPPRIVNLSSMAVYGTASRAVDETSPLPSQLEPYAAAKVAVENFSSTYGNVITLRPGIVYGPKSEWWSNHIARLLISRRLGHLGKNGEGLCNLVHVDDVAATAVCALRLESDNNIFNLSSVSTLTWNDYFQRYAQALNTPCVNISRMQLAYELYVLGPIIKLVEVASKRVPTLRPPPPIRPWLTQLCQQKIRMNSDKAQELLPINWTSVAVGLQRTALWYHGQSQT